MAAGPQCTSGLNKGRTAIPKRMNFWKSSKRPLPPPPLIFGKSYCAFFIMATEPSKVAGTIMQVGMRARQYAIHAHDTYIGLGLAPLSGDSQGRMTSPKPMNFWKSSIVHCLAQVNKAINQVWDGTWQQVDGKLSNIAPSFQLISVDKICLLSAVFVLGTECVTKTDEFSEHGGWVGGVGGGPLQNVSCFDFSQYNC